MSNCIEFKPGRERLVIPFSRMDEHTIQAFKDVLERAKGYKNSDKFYEPSLPEYTDYTLQNVWWFLADNTEITDKAFVIYLGQGRSGHTWRDLKHTLLILGSFITNGEVRQSTQLMDTDAGDNRWFYATVLLTPGEGKLVN